MDLLQKIQSKMQELSDEAVRLTQHKSTLENNMAKVNTRLTQIAGALTELNKIIKDEAEEDSPDKA